MGLISQYLEEKKKCAMESDLQKEGKDKEDSESETQEREEQDSADYKMNKAGKKSKAHKITFNKGEDDGKVSLGEEEMSDAQMKKREKYVKGMKKSYKDFVSKYGADRAKSVMYATATKMAMKEDTEEVEEELKGNQHKLDKNKNGKLDKQDFKMLRKEEQVEEGWEDMLKASQARKDKEEKVSTATKHNVKKVGQGTVYTKQHDGDGLSKEFKRDPNAAKRGRGRPRKSSFGEAVKFLMSVDEDTFNELTQEGFDAFVEAYISETESNQ